MFRRGAQSFLVRPPPCGHGRPPITTLVRDVKNIDASKSICYTKITCICGQAICVLCAIPPIAFCVFRASQSRLYSNRTSFLPFDRGEQTVAPPSKSRTYWPVQKTHTPGNAAIVRLADQARERGRQVLRKTATDERKALMSARAAMHVRDSYALSREQHTEIEPTLRRYGIV